ncbi:S-methyl-5'-thioadenosine phosphorylase [Nitrospinae bacterium AH_259_B05_G02_I21]|nr:S-methyl-5'-thioadenosine phosphorylase [Nitrospinae bacterium AH_259_B05_G02_I21]MDA2932122.1 S-methyl-5'-thioadenosine phosphorylase [Nitrospinae bacterium AH-259-F20]
MTVPRIGVIGGSGLYEMEGPHAKEEVEVDTPYGAPSDSYLIGELGDVSMVFLPRHGRGHRILPTHLNSRANIYGMKKLGVEWIISVSAVGSMREEIEPGHIVIIDQFFDRTRERPSTFFGDGVAGHITFADPVCPILRSVLLEAARAAGATVHDGGTYVCIEGPQFSTRAESQVFRSWGVDVIGMTNLPEARLAREAEICYATIALCTDYDCWHEGEEDVTIEAVLEVVRQNVSTAQAIIKEAASRFPLPRTCPCAEALKHAIMTPAELIPPATRQSLGLLIDKYL